MAQVRLKTWEITDEFWDKVEQHIPGYKPRRWIVEVAHSWSNRFRKIHTRYEKTSVAYYALLYLAAAMLAMNKVMKIYPAL